MSLITQLPLVDFRPSRRLSLCHGRSSMKYLLLVHHNKDMFTKIPEGKRMPARV